MRWVEGHHRCLARSCGQQYFARLSQSDLFVFSTKASSETYVFIGSAGLLTDVKGNSFSNTRLDGAQVRIEVTLDTATGFVYETSLGLENKG